MTDWQARLLQLETERQALDVKLGRLQQEVQTVAVKIHNADGAIAIVKELLKSEVEC